MASRPQRIDACYVCVHVWCAQEGSKALIDALQAKLAACASPVKVKEIDCFGACPQAPSLLLYPEGTWYTWVQPSDLDEIDAHVTDGQPVARLTERVNPKLHQLVLNYLERRIGPV